MTPTIEYLNRYFDIYNAKYFYSILPVPEFELMNTKYLLGQYCPPSTGSNKIRVTKAYEGAEVFFQNTLIHEMIHYYLNFIDDEDKGWARSHGPNFKREASRINKDGWNIQRCATQEEMSMVTLVKTEKASKASLHVNVRSVIGNPLDENQLVNFVLRSKSKEKETILWLSYPEIQRMVYSELYEDHCSFEMQQRRSKAIVKAYQILLDFNSGNHHNLYVLHNDIMHFYAAIGNQHLANLHQIESRKYKGAENTSSYIIKGRGIAPIKIWNARRYRTDSSIK